MKKLQVSLPDALREKLDAAVAKSGNSLGEEIRQRLERTIEQDAIDLVTRELLTGIVNLAANIQADLGAAWHSSQDVQEVFAAAVALRLAGYKPTQNLFEAMGFGKLAANQVKEAPDALGAVIERADRRTHSYELLQHLQAARQRAKARRLLSGMRKKGEDKS
jgi:hypothetical protein